MALPDFGLMTKADKLKLDGIDTTTLLTKTEAASTYATKAEVREYIRQVVESDTGFMFINGNDSEVGLIPVLGKQSANFYASPTSLSMDVDESSNITLTTASSGVISFTPTSNIIAAENAGSYVHAFKITINGKTVTVDSPTRLSTEAIGAFSDTLVLNLAETDNYESATTSVTLNFNGCDSSGLTPDIPEP